MKRIYFDHGATTKVDETVAKTVMEAMLNNFGNPSSIHSFGRTARKSVEESREKVAALLNAQPGEIFFTSGGTESDNLAIKGITLANQKKGHHIITSTVEHHAVLHTCEYLEKNGFTVTYLPVDKYGMVNPEDVREALNNKTILVSIMMGNNEVGTLQPIKEIAAITREAGVYFHTDAVQAVGNMPVDVKDLGVDLLSLSGHKFYGPKGIGALYIRKGVKIAPVQHGGGHERKLRAGTENVPGIIGLARACEIAMQDMPEKVARVSALRDKMIRTILQNIDHVQLNGHPEKRLPGNVNFSFEFVEGESLLLNLDLKGIAASSGSACTSGSLDPSHVLLSMGLSHEIAHGSLRLTLGAENTEDEVDYFLDVIPEIVTRLRAMSPLYNNNCNLSIRRSEVCEHCHGDS
ncbi:MAG TPA: cysteine desulfurase NifS [Negativicutes bacterium]|nr:cysteine desulfurase NifS [Negativicutes bacterium]